MAWLTKKQGKNAHQVLNKEEQKETDDQKTEQNDSENGKEKKSPKSDLGDCGIKETCRDNVDQNAKHQYWPQSLTHR